jgi:hypothetical protein
MELSSAEHQTHCGDVVSEGKEEQEQKGKLLCTEVTCVL